MKRVVVTGFGALTALGHDWETVSENIFSGTTGIRRMEEWDDFSDLNTRLGSETAPFELPPQYNRKSMRSMGRVALLSTRATELALEHAGLKDESVLSSGRTGVAYGASSGSIEPIAAFGQMLQTKNMRVLSSNSYVQMMSHTGAVNIGLFFGITGRIIPTSSACTSGSQGIGYAYESIRSGQQDVMIAGGAEELSAAAAAVFDTLFATSIRNDAPHTTPRPFDRDRDGLVVGEGASTLILEEYEHARARGATIHAEIVGYGTNSDGTHITQPNSKTMATAMQLALRDAGIPAESIGYISAHGTATDRGDIAESLATRQIFGGNTPISSMKSYFGHTLGACGALEAWLGIEMMNAGLFAHTANLENPDPECADLDYIVGAARKIDTEYFMSNNFAFGGINTSLIFRRI